MCKLVPSSEYYFSESADARIRNTDIFTFTKDVRLVPSRNGATTLTPVW